MIASAGVSQSSVPANHRKTLLAVCLAACASAQASPTLVATTDAKIEGYAYVAPGKRVAASSDITVRSLAHEAADHGTRWTLTPVVGDAYELQLPSAITPALASGATVHVTTAVVGGGPNTQWHLAISDDAGPIIAIGVMPAGWTAEPGKAVATDKGQTYDATTYSVLLGKQATNERVELVAGWRKFKLAGHTYLGQGDSVTRDLHVKVPPPDYVPSWLDVAIVRVD
jgi:hypothetical protein